MISNSGTSTLGLYDLKRQIDAFGGVDYFRQNLAGGYLKNARVMLANGDIVKSTVDGNLNDPNVDMTGWVKTNSASQIFDESGADQQSLNEGIESIAALRLLNPTRKGLRVYVKAHTVDTFKGSGWFVATQQSGLVDDDGLIVNSANPNIFWVRLVEDNIYQPEFWGALGEAETLGVDDFEAFEKMFAALSPARKNNGQTWAQARVGLSTKPKTVLQSSLYKHSKTLYIPPFIKFTQAIPVSTPHTTKTQIGIWYDPSPADYDTCAVSNYVYIRDQATGTTNANSKWNFQTDIYYRPPSSEIDNNYFGLAIDLDNLTVITNPHVTLGVRILNAIPSYTFRDLSIGGKIGDYLAYNNYLCPKVGLLQHATYVTKYDSLRVVASVQGAVFSGSAASCVLDQPWIISARTKPITTEPIYKQARTETYTQLGTVGITLLSSECHLIRPTYENWHIGIAAVEGEFLRVERPHAESVCGLYEFYIQKMRAWITSKSHFGSMCVSSFTDVGGAVIDQADTYSAMYLKDLSNDTAYFVKVDGYIEYGTRAVRGENSSAVVDFDLSRYYVVQYFGQIGNFDLVRSFNTNYYDTLYVDPASGNDNNLGFATQKPLKTYIEATKRLSKVKNISNVFFMNDTEINGLQSFTLDRDILFNGTKAVTLNIAANSAIYPALKLGLLRLGSSLTINAINYVVRLQDNSDGSIQCLANFTTQYFAYASGYCDIDISINNTTASCARYFLGNETSGIEQVVGLSVKTGSAVPSIPVSNNSKVVIKYASSNIAYVKTTYDPPSVAANSTVSTVVTVNGLKVGDLVQATFSQYHADIEVSAVVSAADSVTVRFKNNGASAVDLPSGTISIKRV